MYCYRHPDREAYVRCQRCERFICPSCQIEASVGFLCPEDAGQSKVTRAVSNAPRPVRKFLRSDAPVTTVLIGLCVLIWVLQMLPGSLVTDQFLYAPLYTVERPWTLITSGFLHSTSSPFHLALNMYSVYIFGRALEPLLGSIRFAALYLLSLLGGSVALLWTTDLTTGALGASGAIFGLMGAYVLLAKSLGYNSNQFVGLIAINLLFGVIFPGVAWEAHVGGLLTGLVVGAVFVATRRALKSRQTILLVAVAGLLVIAAIAGAYARLGSYYGY